MFKKVLLFATLCTLTACSDDVYDEMNQQNKQNEANGGMQTNSFQDSNPGYINIGGSPFINIGDGYQSPWDIWLRNETFTPIYSFSNRGYSGHTSPLKLEIIPWAGLAYYDDNDDGNYTDLRLAQQPGNNGIVAVMNNGSYPKLFAGSQEVGNLVAGDPITLDGTSIDESELTIASDPLLTPHEHLLANFNNKLGPMNNNNKVFRFSSLTAAEQDLIMKYGKVFYYEVRVYDSSNQLITTEYVQYRNESVDNGDINYTNTPYNATITTPGASSTTVPVLYYKNQDPTVANETQWLAPYPNSPGPNPNYTCNSREVVIPKIYSENVLFNYNGGLNNYKISVGMAIGSYLWRTSGPMLIVQPN